MCANSEFTHHASFDPASSPPSPSFPPLVNVSTSPIRRCLVNQMQHAGCVDFALLSCSSMYVSVL